MPRLSHRSVLRYLLLASIVLGALGSQLSHAKAKSLGTELLGNTQNFLRALYIQKNPEELKKWIASPDEAAFLLAQTQSITRSPQELSEEIEAVKEVSPPFLSFNGDELPLDRKRYPTGTKALLKFDFHGGLTVMPMLKEPSGWKVDQRYLISLKTNFKPTDPEEVAKRFLFSLFQKDLKTLHLLVATPDKASMEILMSKNEFPPGDLDHLLSLVQEMPVAKARQGEIFKMPSGRINKVANTPEQMTVVGLYGSIELPFLLKKIGGEWKVIPEPYILSMRRMGAI